MKIPGLTKQNQVEAGGTTVVVQKQPWEKHSTISLKHPHDIRDAGLTERVIVTDGKNAPAHLHLKHGEKLPVTEGNTVIVGGVKMNPIKS